MKNLDYETINNLLKQNAEVMQGDEKSADKEVIGSSDEDDVVVVQL